MKVTQDALKIIDISPLISESIGVFPGDTPFQKRSILDFSQGHNIRLSAVTSTLHLGAHADSVGHYHKDGGGIEERPLFPYLGSCQLLDASTPLGMRVEFEHLLPNKILAHRVLIRTRSFPDPNRWNSDFCSLSPRLIEELAEQGVILVGIDTPSVDPESSKDLPSHQALFRHQMAVLEGLVLDEAESGLYDLIALPLRIKDADASPVRAILLPPGTVKI